MGPWIWFTENTATFYIYRYDIQRDNIPELMTSDGQKEHKWLSIHYWFPASSGIEKTRMESKYMAYSKMILDVFELSLINFPEK